MRGAGRDGGGCEGEGWGGGGANDSAFDVRQPQTDFPTKPRAAILTFFCGILRRVVEATGYFCTPHKRRRPFCPTHHTQTHMHLHTYTPPLRRGGGVSGAG